MPEIVDLTGKDSDAGSETPPRSKTRAKQSSTRKPPSETDLKARIITCLTRIADAAEARGDEELAEILRDDTSIMANGLVSLTRPFRALRAPLLLLLGIAEPVMAFARIGRLVIGRILTRRADKHTEETTP